MNFRDAILGVGLISLGISGMMSAILLGDLEVALFVFFMGLTIHIGIWSLIGERK